MNRRELRFMRFKEKMTQSQMAEMLQISAERYSRIERGLSFPDERICRALAQFFGLEGQEGEWLK
ncbi:MAG: helix-turn-helix transcriptional regulator [Cloacibacillus sp.]